MYKWSRLLLIVGFLLNTIAFLLVSIAWWPFPPLMLAILLAIHRRKLQALWSHGTARWANAWDLRRQGMVGEEEGLIVGRLVEAADLRPYESIVRLLDPRIPSKRACDQYVSRCAPWFLREAKGEWVRLRKTPHVLICGPTGTGKSSGIIVPFLWGSRESAVVLDYNGELSRITASVRRNKFHQRIALLDPWMVATKNPDCLNPIDFINTDSPDWMDDCRDLAEQLVVRTGQEKDRHWDDGAEMFIAAAIVAMVLNARVEDRSLQTVREILSNPDDIPTLIALLCETGGMAARLGGQLAHFRDKELSSVLTTANRHLRFLDTPMVAANTRASSFNPAELRSGELTVYCVVPPQHMRAQSGLIRMWIGTLMRAVIREGCSKRPVHFVMDEAASFGPHMHCIEDAIERGRAYGIKMQLYYQSLAQLRKCFTEGQHENILANCTQVFFGTNDLSAEYISQRLGEQTLLVAATGYGTSTSTQTSNGAGQGSSTSSTSSNTNWNPVGRRLLKPEEILTLNERLAITFVPGLPPIMTRLQRYYEGHIGSPRFPRFKVLSASLLLLFGAMLCFLFGSLIFWSANHVGATRSRYREVDQGSRSGNQASGDLGRERTRVGALPGAHLHPIRPRPVSAAPTND